jgi:hypothetical protein
MRLSLRTLPAVLLSAAALTLSACGGSDDPDPSADTGTTPVGTASEPTESAAAAEPSEQATGDADDAEWVAITDEPSGITFSMPEAIEAQANSATVADGTSVALRNYSVMVEGDVELGFNVIDTAGEGYDFDAGIQGVADTLGGDVVSTTETEAGGYPAVDVEMTYGEGYIVFFQLVTGEEHIVQSLASGPESQRAAVQQTHQQLSDSVAGY